MICINCFSSKTTVTNSRTAKLRPQVWRRRKCLTCEFTFTTFEDFDLDDLLIVQSGSKSAPFSRGKLLSSVINILKPLGDDLSKAYYMQKTIEHKLIASQKSHGNWQPVTNDVIALLTYETLKSYNQAAGMMYGSAHGLIGNNQKPKRGRPTTI